jgi:carboxyl-terminal processing protease
MKQYKFNYIYIAIWSLILFLGGFYFGFAQQPSSHKVDNVLNQENKDIENKADFEEFWKVWNLIDEKYPDAKKVSNQERIYGAISGLVGSIKDPYTLFLPPEESKSFNDEVTGSFSGIGVEIGIKEGMLVVISPLKGSPAETAGIKAGDYFHKIDDLAVSEMTLDESIRHIRGTKGTQVVLTIIRKEEAQPIDISVTRDIINIPTIDETEIGNTYLISLYNFNASSAELMHKALKNAQLKKMKNIIIDLRGNPGGFLESAIDIASDILPEGTLIVSEDYGSVKKPLFHRSKGNGLVKSDIKIVILLDKGSASASEILAGALQDNKRATVIGETSFGKGSVQELLPVSNDTSLKITIANWLTPGGTTISKKGITPDILVIQDSPKEDPEDPTVQRALEFLKNGK